LFYLSQRVKANNVASLQDFCYKSDKDGSGTLTPEVFEQCLHQVGMGIGEREFKELMKEIDSESTGKVNY